MWVGKLRRVAHVARESITKSLETNICRPSQLWSWRIPLISHGISVISTATWKERNANVFKENCFGGRRPLSAASSPQLVVTDIENGVATLTLKDEKKRNALSSTMMAELLGLLNSFDSDKNVRVVVIRHDGKVFSSGHDLKELQTTQNSLGTTDSIFQLCSNLMIKIQCTRFPVIAEVSGLATAGGCQLVAACDLAIAADTATFSTPGVRIGLFCTTPGVALARALPTKHALEMLLTGEAITAQKVAQAMCDTATLFVADIPFAMDLGMVNRVVPAGELRKATQTLALTIAQAPQQTVALGKRAFYRQVATADLAAAYSFGQGVMVDNMGLPDAAEGIDAFLSKRHPKWLT